MMGMSRRRFIGSFAALAALAVAPAALASAATALTPTDLARLIVGMATGLVEDQVFYLDAPIEINVCVEIRRCKFIFAKEIADETLVTVRPGADGSFIHDCIFVCPNFKGIA